MLSAAAFRVAGEAAVTGFEMQTKPDCEADGLHARENHKQ
jgi:hypothetical protein